MSKALLIGWAALARDSNCQFKYAGTLMNREVMDRWCERGILVAVLAILVAMPLAFGGRPQVATGVFLDFLVVNPFLIAQSLTIVVLVLWCARFWLNERPKLLWPPICWAVLAFGLYAIIRYLTADIEYVARQEMLRILVYVLLFFAILNNLHRQESVQIISFTLIALAMGIASFAVYQFITGTTRVWHIFTPYQHRASGTYISPNHLGGFLEMLLPLGLAYALVSRLKPLTKILVAYAVLVIAAGIAVTVSRGSWFSTVLALLLFFGILFFHDRFRLPSMIFLMILLVAIGYFIPKTYVFQVRLKQLFYHGKFDDDARFTLWQPAYKVWQENPLWGAGPGHFDFRFRKYRPETIQLQPERAHNDFLNVLTDWGLVGASMVTCAGGLLFWGVLRTWRFVRGLPGDLEQKRSNKFAFVLGALLGLAAVLFHSVVDFNMHIPANALLAVALAALLTSHLRFATERYWLSARPWLKTLCSLMLVGGALYLGNQTWRHACERFWFARACCASPFSPDQAELLEQSFGYEPKNFETAYAIGEAYRTQSKEGGDDYQELAAKALFWFDRAIKLNPWDGYSFLRYGMCLDWLERTTESAPYFDRAEQLDPNGYFILANIGLHYVQMRNYAAARPWFERSRKLQWENNPIAQNYIQIANRKLLEAATNDISATLDLSRHLPDFSDRPASNNSGDKPVP